MKTLFEHHNIDALERRAPLILIIATRQVRSPIREEESRHGKNPEI